jgi:hypothetical protein
MVEEKEIIVVVVSQVNMVSYEKNWVGDLVPVDTYI